MSELLYITTLFVLILCSCVSAKNVYVVQMKAQSTPTTFNSDEDWYTETVKSVNPSHDEGLIYKYSAAMQGYAVSLEPHHAEALSNHGAVLGVYENKAYTLQTTVTPAYLRVEDEFGLWGAGACSAGAGSSKGAKVEGSSPDVIIGVIDTGIWPESKSFDDTGFSEIPSRWKGQCVSSSDFNKDLCNKKLIGARSFLAAAKSVGGANVTEAMLSPRDIDGHGTHCASIAAGSPVPHANMVGLANGTAKGMASHARIASYKVCAGSGQCQASDILAGIDQAILDGVDIISISIGSPPQSDYSTDLLAMGAFSAIERGIFFSIAAGNSGPSPSTIGSGAPWMMTTGASNIGRLLRSGGALGNQGSFLGLSFYTGSGMNKWTSLVYNEGSMGSNFCKPGTLDRSAIQGKLVMCDVEAGGGTKTDKDTVVRDAGGVGVILLCEKDEDAQRIPFFIPGIMVSSGTAEELRQYVKSDPNPTAQLFFEYNFGDNRPSPSIEDFSSRGPYPTSPQILKPDVVAPGVVILAASGGQVANWTKYNNGKPVHFILDSGTSMACPHVSGIAALLKAAHPDWSPAAIKSALMTTADILNSTGQPITDSATDGPATPLDMGSGQINPRAALSPGLIYNITTQDYVAFLCSLNYTLQQVWKTTRDEKENCSKKLSDPGHLNYPSFAIFFRNDRQLVRYRREVTNIGEPDSRYHLVVDVPPSIRVKMNPKKLVFKSTGEKQVYRVTFIAAGPKEKINSTFGYLAWKSSMHTVRSPIVFTWL